MLSMLSFLTKRESNLRCFDVLASPIWSAQTGCVNGVVPALITVTTGRFYCSVDGVGRRLVTGAHLLVTGSVVKHLSLPP